MTRPTGREVASTWPVMMMSAICSVNGINSQKPLPQASITCGMARGRKRDAGDDHDAAVASSAKMKASGTQRSVQSVNASAMRARNPGSSGGFVFSAERESGRVMEAGRGSPLRAEGLDAVALQVIAQFRADADGRGSRPCREHEQRKHQSRQKRDRARPA